MTRGATHYMLPTRHDLAWQDRAKCAGWLGFTEMDVEQQADVCNGKQRPGDRPCPVRSNCAAYGVDGPPVTTPEGSTRHDGEVYGGLTPAEIKKLQRQRRKLKAVP